MSSDPPPTDLIVLAATAALGSSSQPSSLATRLMKRETLQAPAPDFPAGP